MQGKSEKRGYFIGDLGPDIGGIQTEDHIPGGGAGMVDWV